MERRLRIYTNFWLQDPSLLDEPTNQDYWMRLCVTYFSDLLTQGVYDPLVLEQSARTGIENLAVVRRDMAHDI
eukprot:7275972-Pyramimonas_sp.AAC.1